MIKKFKCEVIRHDQYEIEFDTDLYTEKDMEDFRELFYDFKTYEQHAEHLAQIQARFGNETFNSFIEGYGHVKRDGKFQEHGVSCKSLTVEGINIKIISEDEDWEVETKEIVD